MQHKQSELTKIEKKRQKAEDALKEKKKESGTIQRELAKIEQDIREVVSIFSHSITFHTLLAVFNVTYFLLRVSSLYLFYTQFSLGLCRSVTK